MALAFGLFFILWGSPIAVLAQGGEPPSRRDPEIELLKTEMAQLRKQMEDQRAESERQLKALREQLDEMRLEAQEPEDPPAPPLPQTTAETQQRYNLFNPAISAIGNFFGRWDDKPAFREEGRTHNQANLREVELDLRLPVDPFADAVAILALESEVPGEFEASVEEGYLTLKRLPFLEEPPWGLKLKIGRFRPEMGKLNKLHLHDLPQITRPLVVQEFLGEEGFIQSGLSAQFFLPTPWDEESALELTLQGLSGGINRYASLGHLRWFRTFANVHNLEVGASSYYSRDEQDRELRTPRLFLVLISGEQDRRPTWLHGLDFLYKWKPLRAGEWQSFLLGGELFYSEWKIRGAADEFDFFSPTVTRKERPLGYYLFGQYQWDRRWYAGVRWDWTQTIVDDRFERMKLTPYLSYYFSEFLRARIGYEHTWSDLVEENGRDTFLFELNWVFGAHPPEPFWVNK